MGYLIKGLMSILPTISIFWFMLSVINMGAPPSINLLSEIILLICIVFNSLYISVLVFLSSFLAACYSLYIYTSTQHGQLSSYINGLVIINFCIISSLLFHIFPVFLLIISS